MSQAFTDKTISFWRSFRIALYGLLLAFVAVWSYCRPAASFDRYLYAAAAASLNSSNPKEIHDEALRRANWGLDRPHTSFSDDVFNNPAHMVQQIPFYTIRPAYVWLIKYVPIRAVSPAAYILLGVVILMWTQSVLWSGLLLLIGPVLLSAHYATPDELAALFVVGGIALLFYEYEMTGLAVLLASITVRTDNVLFLMGACLWMVLAGRVTKVKGVVVGMAGILCVVTINHLAGNYGWGVLIGHSFNGGFVEPATMRGYHPTMSQYCTYLVRAILYLPLTALGMWAILATYAWIQNRMRAIVLIAAGFNVAHVLLFPIPDDRYFVASYLITAVVAAPIGPLREKMQRKTLV
jgi:hypothetical protein